MINPYCFSKPWGNDQGHSTGCTFALHGLLPKFIELFHKNQTSIYANAVIYVHIGVTDHQCFVLRTEDYSF
jgi:hypothetical protein